MINQKVAVAANAAAVLFAIAYEVTKAIADFKSGNEEKPDDNSTDEHSQDSS